MIESGVVPTQHQSVIPDSTAAALTLNTRLTLVLAIDSAWDDFLGTETAEHDSGIGINRECIRFLLLICCACGLRSPWEYRDNAHIVPPMACSTDLTPERHIVRQHG